MKATAQGRPRGAKLQHRDFGSRQGWRGGAELKKDRNKAKGVGGDFTPPRDICNSITANLELLSLQESVVVSAPLRNSLKTPWKLGR